MPSKKRPTKKSAQVKKKSSVSNKKQKVSRKEKRPKTKNKNAVIVVAKNATKRPAKKPIIVGVKKQVSNLKKILKTPIAVGTSPRGFGKTDSLKEIKNKVSEKTKVAITQVANKLSLEPASVLSDELKSKAAHGLTEKEIAELEKKKKTYWTDDTEASVAEYLKNDFVYYKIKLDNHLKECNRSKTNPDQQKIAELQQKIDETNIPEIVAYRNHIYEHEIQKPFNKLVENIIYNFKLFRLKVDVKTLHDDCVSFVYQKIANFDPTAHSKSFSYYGTIAKHYLQGEKKDDDKSTQINLDYDYHRDEADKVETEEIGKSDPLSESGKLFEHVIQSIEHDINGGWLSENDTKVGYTIIKIMKGHEIIGFYNKNQIYELIRSATNLPTKDITYSLSRFRQFYKLMKERYVKKSSESDDL